MKDMGLEIERESLFETSSLNDGFESGIIAPPPSDPLHGLQVVLENGMTRGYLQTIQTQRTMNRKEAETETGKDTQPQGKSKEDTSMEKYELASLMKQVDDKAGLKTSPDSPELEKRNVTKGTDAEMEKKISSDEEAIAESRRKAEKMEMLRKRAEEALNRRKKKKE
jgi:hypothetical protein